MSARAVMRAVCLRKPMITCVAGRTESKTSPEWMTRSTSRSRMASTALPYASWTSTSRWLRPVFGHSFAYLVYPRCVSEMCAMRTILLTYFRLLSQGYSSRSVSFFLWSVLRQDGQELVRGEDRYAPKLALVFHAIEPGEYARGVPAVAPGLARLLEVPDEVLERVGGAVAGAVRRGHHVERFVDH